MVLLATSRHRHWPLKDLRLVRSVFSSTGKNLLAVPAWTPLNDSIWIYAKLTDLMIHEALIYFDIFWYYDSHWFPELYPVSTWFKKWSCRSCPIKSPYPIMIIMSHLSPVPEWGDVVTKETSVMSTSAHLWISRSPSFPMLAFTNGVSNLNTSNLLGGDFYTPLKNDGVRQLGIMTFPTEWKNR